jgi:hypothetical protein
MITDYTIGAAIPTVREALIRVSLAKAFNPPVLGGAWQTPNW